MEKIFCVNCRYYDKMSSPMYSACLYNHIEILDEIDCVTGKNITVLWEMSHLVGSAAFNVCSKANKNFDCKYYKALTKPHNEAKDTSFLKKIINLITRRKIHHKEYN